MEQGAEATDELSSNASGEEAASNQDPPKLGSISVTVPEPSKGKIRDGKIYPFGMGRSRSSSTRASTNSFSKLFFKDTWAKAELFLTETTICYEIEAMGVRSAVRSVF